MMEILLLIVCAIIGIFIFESLEKKTAQSRFERLKLITLQVICTLTLGLLVIIFFSDVLNASESQIDIIAPVSLAMSFFLCAYIFKRRQ